MNIFFAGKRRPSEEILKKTSFLIKCLHVMDKDGSVVFYTANKNFYDKFVQEEALKQKDVLFITSGAKSAKKLSTSAKYQVSGILGRKVSKKYFRNYCELYSSVATMHLVVSSSNFPCGKFILDCAKKYNIPYFDLYSRKSYNKLIRLLSKLINIQKEKELKKTKKKNSIFESLFNYTSPGNWTVVPETEALFVYINTKSNELNYKGENFGISCIETGLAWENKLVGNKLILHHTGLFNSIAGFIENTSEDEISDAQFENYMDLCVGGKIVLVNDTTKQNNPWVTDTHENIGSIVNIIVDDPNAPTPMPNAPTPMPMPTYVYSEIQLNAETPAVDPMGLYNNVEVLHVIANNGVIVSVGGHVEYGFMKSLVSFGQRHEIKQFIYNNIYSEVSRQHMMYLVNNGFISISGHINTPQVYTNVQVVNVLIAEGEITSTARINCAKFIKPTLSNAVKEKIKTHINESNIDNLTKSDLLYLVDAGWVLLNGEINE